MTWHPIAFLPPQYENTSGDPYSGAVLKAYSAGTTANIPLATSYTGATTAGSLALNSLGFPVYGGNVVIPHVQENYKLALYPTQAAADLNSGAVWTVDNIYIVEATSVTVNNEQIDVFAIGGQSNAQGSSADPANGPDLPSGIAYQYYGGALSALTTDPVGNANTGSAWPAFALAWYNATGRKICLVPCAVGGTDQSKLAGVGSDNWDDTGTLRATLVTKTTAALVALVALGYVPALKGVLWSQGENDAGAIGAATITKAQYKTALTTMLAYWRGQSFNGIVYPYLPVYISTTGGPAAGDSAGYQQVRTAQREVGDADFYTLITFDGAFEFIRRGTAYMQAATLHYTQAGYNEMGTCMARGVLTGGLGVDEAMKIYTPVCGLINSLGNGSVTGLYQRRGNLIIASINVVIGSTTTTNAGTFNITLPTLVGSGAWAAGAYALDNGTGHQQGISNTVGGIDYFQIVTDNAAGVWSGTDPMTWATGDQLHATVTYSAV